MSEQIDDQVSVHPKLDSQLCFAVHSASSVIDQLYRPLLAEHDLTYSQYIALMTLAEKDGVSITALAQRMGLTKATMTPLLKRLEEKQLISRNMEDGNERQKRVLITDQGRSLLTESCYVTEQVFAKTGLTPSRAHDLIKLCKIISKSAPS